MTQTGWKELKPIMKTVWRTIGTLIVIAMIAPLFWRTLVPHIAPNFYIIVGENWERWAAWLQTFVTPISTHVAYVAFRQQSHDAREQLDLTRRQLAFAETQLAQERRQHFASHFEYTQSRMIREVDAVCAIVKIVSFGASPPTTQRFHDLFVYLNISPYAAHKPILLRSSEY